MQRAGTHQALRTAPGASRAPKATKGTAWLGPRSGFPPVHSLIGVARAGQLLAAALRTGLNHENRKSRTPGNSELISARSGTAPNTRRFRMKLAFHVMRPGPV